MTFELVDLFIAFIAGFAVALSIVGWAVSRVAARLREVLQRALEEETKSAQPSTEQQVSAGKIIPLTIEVENNQYFCYNSNTNEFVCQGADVKEITTSFQSRFPGFNAFIKTGNEEAVKTLRQQLKDNRESSSSIGSTS